MPVGKGGGRACACLQGTVLIKLIEDLSTVGGTIPWAGDSGVHNGAKKQRSNCSLLLTVGVT